MGLSHEIELRCRHCLIIYTGETVTVVRRRWWLRSYRRRFRVDGQWPLHLAEAVRHRYWRRLRVHTFPVWGMRPIEITQPSGRGPWGRPPMLTFARLRSPDRSVTVLVTTALLVRNGDVIRRINRAIAQRAPKGASDAVGDQDDLAEVAAGVDMKDAVVTVDALHAQRCGCR